MPMFEIFPPLFNSKKIEQWTANEFWKHLKLSKKERNRFNRQRMYRRDGSGNLNNSYK
jgi:hypothetical protein